MSFCGGLALNHLGGIANSFQLRVHISTVFILATSGTVLFVPPVKIHRINEALPTIPLSQNLRRLATSLTVILFVATVFAFGTFGGMYNAYYGFFLEKVLGASESQMGANWAMATLSEVFGYMASGRLHKIIGYEKSLMLVYAVYVVRFLAYSFVHSPWLSYPIDCLHFFTFGIMWTTVASYANAIAPPEAQATLQAIVSAVYNSLGRATGSFAGGMAISAFGYRLAFLIMSINSLVLGLAYSTAVSIKNCHKRLDRGHIGGDNGIVS